MARLASLFVNNMEAYKANLVFNTKTSYSWLGLANGKERHDEKFSFRFVMSRSDSSNNPLFSKNTYERTKSAKASTSKAFLSLSFFFSQYVDF